MEFLYLPKTSVWAGLSAVGKTIETPKGIFYWSSRAKNEAKIDGTIGIAQDDDGTISHLKIAEDFVGEKVLARAPNGKIFAYAPIEGLDSLRKKWLAKMLLQHPGVKNCTTMPVVTNGITHSLAIAGRLFLNPGDVLITAEKSWENYEHIYTGVQGAKIETFKLFTDTGAFNHDALIEKCKEVAARQKKVILLLNFPHNQTGYMPTSADAKELGKRLQKLIKSMPQIPFVVLLDDAYEGYVYDSGASAGQKFSLLSDLYAPLPNFTIVKMDGISKVLLSYGYRVGFLTVIFNMLDGSAPTEDFLKGASSEMGTKIGGFVRGEISQVSHHGQVLADALLEDSNAAEVAAERAEVIARLAERWSVMMTAIAEQSKKFGREKIWADPCNGGFFCYLNLGAGLDAKKVADRLITEKKVGVVPSEQGLRVAFAGVAKEKIPEMIEAIFAVAYI